MTEAIFGLCALMSVVCAVMLFRGYRQERSHLLFWSSICFALMAVTNTILVVDVVVLPQLEFNGSFWRSFLNAAASSVLVFGLIWELA